MTNYSRLFAEAVAEAILDDLGERPERLVEGYWQIRLHRRGPWVPARTYWTHCEPGNSENPLDRWPLPILAGELMGVPIDASTILAARWRRQMPVPTERMTIDQEYRFQVAASQWSLDYEADPKKPVNLLKVQMS